MSKYNSFDDAFISAKETSDEFDFYDKSTFRIKSEIAKKSLYFFVDELNKEMYLVNNKKGYNFLKNLKLLRL